MSEVMQFFLALGVLITLAKTFGYIGTRFGQPSSIWFMSRRCFLMAKVSSIQLPKSPNLAYCC